MPTLWGRGFAGFGAEKPTGAALKNPEREQGPLEPRLQFANGSEKGVLSRIRPGQKPASLENQATVIGLGIGRQVQGV